MHVRRVNRLDLVLRPALLLRLALPALVRRVLAVDVLAAAALSPCSGLLSQASMSAALSRSRTAWCWATASSPMASTSSPLINRSPWAVSVAAVRVAVRVLALAARVDLAKLAEPLPEPLALPEQRRPALALDAKAAVKP
jgi:hypothetical protein